LLILRSEDLFEQVEQIWPCLLHFLDLQPIAVPAGLPQANAGSGNPRSIDPALRDRLRDQLSETVAGIWSRYGITWEWGLD